MEELLPSGTYIASSAVTGRVCKTITQTSTCHVVRSHGPPVCDIDLSNYLSASHRSNPRVKDWKRATNGCL